MRIAALAAVAMAALLTTANAAPAPLCMDAEAADKARAIMLEGFEAGLRHHAQAQFENWLRDPSEQPKRAARGMRIGVEAYVRSRAAALKWSPLPCDPEKLK